jgi:hypothetical protein
MAKRMTLLELCTRAAIAAEGGDAPGWRDRARISRAAGATCAFVIEWAWMIRETGLEAPTVDDYVAWAHVSRRTGFYRQAAFRKLFGEWHDDPTPLARYVNAWVERHGDQHPRSAAVPDVLAVA